VRPETEAYFVPVHADPVASKHERKPGAAESGQQSIGITLQFFHHLGKDRHQLVGRD
jgi:hypothetical protein